MPRTDYFSRLSPHPAFFSLITFLSLPLSFYPPHFGIIRSSPQETDPPPLKSPPPICPFFPPPLLLIPPLPQDQYSCFFQLGCHSPWIGRWTLSFEVPSSPTICFFPVPSTFFCFPSVAPGLSVHESTPSRRARGECFFLWFFPLFIRPFTGF